MRTPHALLAATLAIAGCSAPDPTSAAEPGDEPGEVGRRWITIGDDALETARAALARGATGAIEPIERGDGAALLEVDARDLRALSEAMHEAHQRCSGFVVHEAIEDARAALRATAAAAAVAELAPTYTLDNAAAVDGLLPALGEAGILSVIQQLSAYPSRYYTSSTGIAASTWIRDQWAGLAAGHAGVGVTQFTHAAFPQKSVIATIPGTVKPGEVVVLGAHLDSISSGATAPGADDDASGVAVLTEVLRAMLARDFRPERTVRFIAYAAEEVGLRGSKDIVADAQAKGVNVVGVLNLDMTNYKGSTRDIYLMQDFTTAALNTFVGKLIDTYVGATWGTDMCGYACSDHASWFQAGYPAAMPAEATFADTNPTLHTVNDTLAQSGNTAAHAIKFARLGAAFVAEVAKGTVGPQNAAPTVSISSPAADQTLPGGRAVQLAGTATDAEDGAISDRLAWSSSVDGDLGTGATRSVTLSPGVHTITATVRDSAGAAASASASVTITVDGGGQSGGCAAGGGAGGLALLGAIGAIAALLGRARPRARRARPRARRA